MKTDLFIKDEDVDSLLHAVKFMSDVALGETTQVDYFSSAENGAKPLIDYVHENYCSNRDVATGSYDCPYATTVMNTICCTGHECNHKGIYEKPVVNNTAPFEYIVINEEDLPF